MTQQVKIEAVADDGFGHPCFRIVQHDGTPTFVGYFVTAEWAEKFIGNRKSWELLDIRPQLSLV